MDIPYSDKTFSQKYELVKEFHFSNDNIGPLTLIGSSTPKTCLFCGGKPPQVSFSQIKHIIPEGLGNKHLRYDSECDDCNGQFGRKLDNALGDELKVLKSVARKRGHKMKNAFRHLDDQSRIESDAAKDHILLKLFQNERGITYSEDTNAKTFTLKVIAPRVNEADLIRNFIRMGLMMLPFNEANQETELKTFVKGAFNLQPRYYCGFIIGPGLEYTSLLVFRAKKHEILVGKYAIILRYSHHFYLYETELDSNGRHGAFIMPPPEFLGITTNSVHVRSIQVLKDQKTKRTPTEITFGYREREETQHAP